MTHEMYNSLINTIVLTVPFLGLGIMVWLAVNETISRLSRRKR